MTFHVTIGLDINVALYCVEVPPALRYNLIIFANKQETLESQVTYNTDIVILKKSLDTIW